MLMNIKESESCRQFSGLQNNVTTEQAEDFINMLSYHLIKDGLYNDILEHTFIYVSLNEVEQGTENTRLAITWLHDHISYLPYRCDETRAMVVGISCCKREAVERVIGDCLKKYKKFK